jgi:ABC-type lipoprotein export system ATPase subunit
VALLETDGVCMEYAQPGAPVVALHDVSVRIEAGEFAVVTGESGSGKSTLLSLLGALEQPTRGSVRFRDEKLGTAGSGRLTEFRRDHVGFVFQDFRLVQHLSALDNVLLPLLFSGCAERRELARERLEKVNLGQRLRHRPRSLSRGEMQRVALVRALVNAPDVLLADEPTANLDRRNSGVIWDLLRELHGEEGLTVVVATHNPELVRDASHVIRLQDGTVVSDERR